MPKVGYKLIATIKDVKGSCSHGHKVGDILELDGHNTGGLCGFFYHTIFHDIVMLQFGGSFPPTWVEDPDVMELECPDKSNAVVLELRRIR